MSATATHPQHLEALANGNVIRLNGARFRREVAALPFPEGLCFLADVLDDPRPDAEGVRLLHFLTAAHRVGEHKAIRILRRAGIFRMSPARKVRDLTIGERRRIALELRRGADRSERGW